MKSYKKIVVGFVITLIVLIFFWIEFDKSNKNTGTEVIVYKQTYIPKISKEGSCWTVSTAAFANGQAYRCTVGSYIYDPCFKAETNQLVCDIDPDILTSGFELKLTEKLPDVSMYDISGKERIWRAKLENGLICEIISGTAGRLKNGEWYFYSCNNNAVLIGSLSEVFNKRDNFWKVQVADQNENVTEINVLKVWK